MKKKQYRVKFLGGVNEYTPKQLDEAVRAVAGALADPSTPEVTPEEREALRDTLDALGLVAPDDPTPAQGGKTMPSTLPYGS
ncbi:hypothetical protein SEA_KEANU_84 [Streptomyces phage Keanu]|nr:hypothetical protein SEA_KEANU_84 [Streptomyces phage Keanu]